MPAPININVRQVFTRLREEDEAHWLKVHELKNNQALKQVSKQLRGVVWHRIKMWETLQITLQALKLADELIINTTRHLLAWWFEYPTINDAQKKTVQRLVSGLLDQFGAWYQEADFDTGAVMILHLETLLSMKQVFLSHAKLFERFSISKFYKRQIELLESHTSDLLLMKEQKEQLRELRRHLRLLGLSGNLITPLLRHERAKLKSSSLPSIIEETKKYDALPPAVFQRRHSCPSFFNRRPVLPPIVTSKSKQGLCLAPEKK